MKHYVFQKDEIDLSYKAYHSSKVHKPSQPFRPNLVVVSNIPQHKRVIHYGEEKLFLSLPQMHFYTFIWLKQDYYENYGYSLLSIDHNMYYAYNSIVFVHDEQYCYPCLPNIRDDDYLSVCGSEIDCIYELVDKSDLIKFVKNRISWFFSSEFNDDIDIHPFVIKNYEPNSPHPHTTTSFMYSWSYRSRDSEDYDFLPKCPLELFNSGSNFIVNNLKNYIKDFS